VKIPLVDLQAPYRTLRAEILREIESVLESGAFIQGKRVAEFERAFAEMHRGAAGVPFAAACSSGTAALELVLEALEIGAGDEVITTPHTFVATAEAICRRGARLVLADINPATYTIDPDRVDNAVTPKTRALVPVHIHGNPCRMDRLMEIADRHGLSVIEDCAQAHGARFQGRPVGTFGEAAIFSFYPAKNLGACGDAGMVFTREESLHKKVRMLLDHGRLGKKYVHERIGCNQRMDELQAAILTVRLKTLAEGNATRRRLAAVYERELLDSGLQFMRPTVDAEPVYHHFPVQLDRRDDVAERLSLAGIGTASHYPIPVHQQPAFRGLELGGFPVAEGLARRTLSLPIYPELPVEQVGFICGVLRTLV